MASTDPTTSGFSSGMATVEELRAVDPDAARKLEEWLAMSGARSD